MSEQNKRFAPGLLLCAGLALTLGTQLQAQTFQFVYGGQNDDAARGGVVQTNDGGFISVGESRSFGAGDYDVYVVKTDRCGNLEWSSTYNIGGDDIGRKIRQTVDDGYIIVGSTTDKDNCCQFNNIFLLKIKNDGTVDWVKTYGGRDDEQGFDVQLYNGGKEYVVAGNTTSFGAGKVDAYLLRTDFTGNVIEARVYGGDAVESFNSVAVADDGTGDIFATGETNSYGLGTQILLGRFDAGLNPVWIHHHGGDREEVGNSVITAVKNTVVVAGYSTSTTGARDGYILRVDATTGAYLNDRVYFPIDEQVDDELKEIRELRSGELAAVGYATKAPNGFGDHDVWFLRVDFNLNTQFTWLYGAKGFDEGWSISLQYNSDDALPDYTFAGVTNNWAFGLEDLYLIRTDVNGKSGCNEAETKTNEKQPKYLENRVETCSPRAIVECNRRAERVRNENQKLLCQDCPKGLNIMNPLNLGLRDNGVRGNNISASSSSVVGHTSVDIKR